MLRASFLYSCSCRRFAPAYAAIVATPRENFGSLFAPLDAIPARGRRRRYWCGAEVGGGGLERLKEVSEHLDEALHCSKSIASAG